MPAPGEGEALIDVTAVGLCGSDRHWVTEGEIGDAALERPLVLGHEFAGTIASGPRAGERVALDPADAVRPLRRLRRRSSSPLPATSALPGTAGRTARFGRGSPGPTGSRTRFPTRSATPRRRCSSRSASRSMRSTSATSARG